MSVSALRECVGKSTKLLQQNRLCANTKRPDLALIHWESRDGMVIIGRAPDTVY
jgi:hypothetical protein